MNWIELESEIKKLAQLINFTPTLVVGIARGGLIPALLLSKELKITRIHCLTVKKFGNERKVLTQITEPLKGEQILLIEDMLESGGSLQAAREYLEATGADVSTCCLYTLPTTAVQPDFSLQVLDSIVEFPWE